MQTRTPTSVFAALCALILTVDPASGQGDILKQDNTPAQPPPPAEGFIGQLRPSYHGGPIAQILASGWVNQSLDPVTRIVWWGGHKGWSDTQAPDGTPSSFVILMWTNDPNEGLDFSRPAQPIWSYTGTVSSIEHVGSASDTSEEPAATVSLFRYDMLIPYEQGFTPEPVISPTYWISIGALGTGPLTTAPWGWFMRIHPWPSERPYSAVAVTNPAAPAVGESFLSGYAISGDLPHEGAYILYASAARTDDYGDAPDSYQTLQSNDGARHTVTSALYIGTAPDLEGDGSPGPSADGDDQSGTDDENPPAGLSNLAKGATVTIPVAVHGDGGFLSLWIDFNQNGDFQGFGEGVANSLNVSNGTNYVTFSIPSDAVEGSTLARMRLTTAENVSPGGSAPDGEVEDYAINIEGSGLDFGDALEGFPVTLAEDGARHVTPSPLYLGTLIDRDADGVHSEGADADDTTGIDDEDGVVVIGSAFAGQIATLDLTASAPGLFSLWIDLDHQTNWNEAGERVLNSIPVTAGLNRVQFELPSDTVIGALAARARLSTSVLAGATGEAPDGEVEDFLITVSTRVLDWGDAPTGFPVMLAQNGARHAGPSPYFLGSDFDGEADGQSSALADGDDLSGVDDEDGVAISGSLVPGGTAQLVLRASTQGFASAWVDFDRNLTWTESTDGVFTNLPLVAGSNSIAFTVPVTAALGTNVMRVRFASSAITSFAGEAADGEVEDHLVVITSGGSPMDFGDAPTSFPVRASGSGAQHTVVAGIRLGNAIDAESDGQPSASADGDDLAGADDEDGIEFPPNLISDVGATVRVVASVSGFIGGWLDANTDGDWNDTGEHIWQAVPVTAGTNALSLGPLTLSGASHALRIRFATTASEIAAPTGMAADGEVEDYLLSSISYDWSDAPAGYPTVGTENGARHEGPSALYLGSRWDGEGDGLHSADANADDLNGTDDEDGVVVPGGLRPGATNEIEITASAPGWIHAWFDFNSDGQWTGATENVFNDVAVTGGLNRLTVVVPATVTAPVIARFRLSSLSGLDYTGPAGDGEVEDYRLPIDTMDYGDASGFFPVLREDDGARHAGPSAYFLGTAWDAEGDGHPTVGADGDDTTGSDDEDGVSFVGGFLAGSSNLVRIVTSTSGVLNIWIDFNGDGAWTSANEQVATDFATSAGTNDLFIRPPPGALLGSTMARVRFSSVAGLSFTGAASDGEVEDYALSIQGYDFGDSPTNYPVTLDRNGARHLGPSALRLGSQWDAELDGAPNAVAAGDDLTGSPDDEDGIAVVGLLIPGSTGVLEITSTGTGFLSGWADLNRDGDWGDAGEKILSDVVVSAGAQNLAWTIPPSLTPGPLFARFRLSTISGLGVTGPAPDGEVEDEVLQASTIDFGDAPIGYPVTASADGARHAGPSAYVLGAQWDSEINGTHSTAADADDQAGLDDEDGIIAPEGLRAGRTNALEVIASVAGFLQGWFDLDGNGSWSAEERLIPDVALTAGTNTLLLALPDPVSASSLFARFRFGSATGLAVTGFAVDGEVEDHRFLLQSEDFGDAAASFPVTRAEDGARHSGPSSYFLGSGWDAESDATESSNALGDDLTESDDEDGVVLPSGLLLGSTNQITVTASTNGFLNIWVDLDGDGTWSVPNEHLIVDAGVGPGANSIPLIIPGDATPGTSFIRVRFASTNGLSATGPATDGEVEDYALVLQTIDFGDAPVGYPVSTAASGASHRGPSPYYLGTRWDGESDGVSSAASDSDDLTGVDDEDGVTVVDVLAPGISATVRVVAATSGVLNVWADLSRNTNWSDAGERLVADRALVKGTNLIALNLPASLTPGALFTRFRFASSIGGGLTGEAADGEVEDYRFMVLALDFGDAASSYPVTLAANGARHAGPTALYLGQAWDAETNGLASLMADADDMEGLPDDEDGVAFPAGLIAGGSNRVIVTASTNGVFQLWADLDGNGSWTDAGEQVVSNAAVSAGSQDLWINLPGLLTVSRLALRARLATTPHLASTGFAYDGEVEDYVMDLSGLDFGDAPSGYPVTRIENGAMHRGPGTLFLGAYWDRENDGTHSDTAEGDDLNAAPDDEDGISLPSDLRPGAETNVVRVAASAAGLLQVWIDLDRNGSWGDSGEQVATDLAVTAGVNRLLLPLPESITAGTLIARFRLSTVPGLPFTGEAPDGEVEDVRLGVTESFTRDFGDLPAPYPTRADENGAAHIVSTALRLGAEVDVEVDGQPDAFAMGDNGNGLPEDEDGVVFPPRWMIGTATNIDVLVSDSGILQAWFDFNRDGDWSDPTEQVATDLSVQAGTNRLSVTLPSDALVGPVAARFRLSTSTGIAPTGVAPDGEVEDHMVVLLQPQEGVVEPQITAFERVNGQMVVRFATISNGFYELQSSADLTADPAWFTRDRVRAAPLNAMTNTEALIANEAFRVVAPYVSH